MKGMDSDRWRLVNEVLLEILDTPEMERDARLIARCGDDRRLREEVAALLRADARVDGDLAPFVDPAAPVSILSAPPRAGERLGPYRLLREIGSGGMAVVYLAEREDEFRKHVAIKIVRAGYGESLQRRFQHERQMLAGLVHPNIAQLLDGGTTKEGFPYLVMEYVDGESITAYCERHDLPVDARVRLLVAVCGAVHYAHQNLIVHRDLKPANILVLADGTPKLLDFGIAKLLDETSTAGLTLTGLHPMTPDYASPEQARGHAVTTATDVYSLGVILYELVCGQRPYALASSAPGHVSRMLDEADPPRPGTVKTGVPADVETIILMAMRKEPERRYVSAAAMADDLQRYLGDFPVLARQDTLRYRVGRFVRRNRAPVAASMVVAASLVAGAGVATWQARRARTQQAIAERRLDEARRFTTALIHDLASRNTESVTATRAAFAAQAVDYLTKLAREAAGDLQLQDDLADAFLALGNFNGDTVSASSGNLAAAQASYEKSIALYTAVLAANPKDQRASRSLAGAYSMDALMLATHDAARSLEAHRKALELGATEFEGPEPTAWSDALNQSVLVGLVAERSGVPYYSNVGRTADAAATIRRAIALGERAAAAIPLEYGRERLQLPNTYALDAGVLWAQGQTDEAIAVHRRAIAGYQTVLAGAASGMEFARSELGLLHTRLANLLEDHGDHREAVATAREGVAIIEPIAQADAANFPNHRNLARACIQLGAVLSRTDPGAALAALDRARAVIARFLGRYADEPSLREQLGELERAAAVAFSARGDRAAARSHARTSIELLGGLHRLDPRNARYAFLLAVSLETEAEVLDREDDLTGAAAARGSALAIARPLADADSASALKRRLVTELEATHSGHVVR